MRRDLLVNLVVVFVVVQSSSTAYTIISHGLEINRFSSSRSRLSHSSNHHRRQFNLSPLFSEPDNNDDVNSDPNRWLSSDAEAALYDASWEESRRGDGSLWSSFSNLNTDGGNSELISDELQSINDIDGGEDAWLDVLSSIAADEVEFMSKEADRADKVRQMQEMGFGSESISSTLGVAIDDELENDINNAVFEAFKAETAKTGFGLMVDDDVDLETVESHTRVELDDQNEPVRLQHVYVDEVTCIGCTNCAMIAQSTFFMNSEHGRARVFNQWGDDDEIIAIAIQTCPVDCIHYVSYDELKRLEIERRGQNINAKARLVSQGEYRSGAGYQAKYGGGATFTDQQVISGNMGSRCNNCPSRGCKNCPMFGVGLNPEFQKKEDARKERLAKAEMKKRMESQNKRADL